ncbi:MAG: hypothetical protein ABIO68_00120 [Sphingomicrobium sp.]
MTADGSGVPAEFFLHVRVLIGVILGLSIGKLLSGLAAVSEQARTNMLWWVHMGWVVWAILSVLGFWWWEFQLFGISDWTFGKYLFLFTYAASYYVLCAMLFPQYLEEKTGYKNYFLDHRKYFFGVVAISSILDIGDTLLKGTSHLASLGIGYFLRIAVILAICAIGARSRNARIHSALILLALASQIAFFFIYFNRLI